MMADDHLDWKRLDFECVPPIDSRGRAAIGKKRTDGDAGMTPEDRAWMQALQEQANKNTAAIVASGEVMKHLTDGLTLANSLLVAVGNLCAELAFDSDEPHGRLEEILAGFESSMLQVLGAEATSAGLKERAMRQMDLLRRLAESTLDFRMERRN
jgi:hypothetical protein